jgi:Anti-sigma-28 factor, FlgM
MRIDPSFSGAPIPNRRPGRIESKAAGSASRSSAASTSDAKELAEIDPFLSALQDLPEVRTEVLEEVRQRLQRGEFLTREAAEQTADAILSDLASFIG